MTATVKGTGEVVALTIDPKVVDPDDVETLQDLVIGAIKDAAAKAQELAAPGSVRSRADWAGALPGLPDF